MTLAAVGYRTKNDLKASVGKELSYAETSLFGKEYKDTGVIVLVGPTSYTREWFAEVEMKDGLIAKVT